MKYAVALAALAAVVAAQDASIIPECARQCLLDATASASSCQAGDYACTCLPDNKAAISTAGTGCVVAACGVDVALTEVLPASDKLCAAAGAGSGAPSGAVSSAASSASASADPTPVISSTAVASSAAAADPILVIPSAAPSVSVHTSASGSASLPVITGSVTSVPLPSAVSSTRASNATVTGPGGPASTVVQAGAAGLGSVGGLAMLVLGALAL